MNFMIFNCQSIHAKQLSSALTHHPQSFSGAISALPGKGNHQFYQQRLDDPQWAGIHPEKQAATPDKRLPITGKMRK
jgi:hypothetical protein